MLYHPCAHPMEVSRLKKVVRECWGKHVITPSTLVPPDRVSSTLHVFTYVMYPYVQILITYTV